MFKKQLLALAGIAGIGSLLLSAPAANALTVTIGLQQAGVNGGAITNEGTTGSVSTSYGTFSTNIVGATGQPLPFDLLSATSLNTSSSTAGTLNVWVTVQGLTSPVSSALSFLSAFTSNVLQGSITSVTEKTFLDSGNGLFTGSLLDTWTFTSIGTNTQTNTGNTGAGPYSVTAEFTIVATGTGNTTSTVDLSTTPIPAALPLFAGGLGLVGLLARRKKRKGVAADPLA